MDQVMEQIREHINNHEDIMLTGLAGTARAYLLNIIAQWTNPKLLCLVAKEEKAYDLARELQGFYPHDRIGLFLGRDFVFMKENISRVEIERIQVLNDCLLHPRRRSIIIATAAGMLYPILSPEEMKAKIINIAVDNEYIQPELLHLLVKAGYTRTDTVTRPGELAIRGGIMDIFPLQTSEAYRVEFFGDLVESIRRFDVNSQISTARENEIYICPADELLSKEIKAMLPDYLDANSLVFFDEPRNFFQVFEKEQKRYHELIQQARKDEKTIRELPLVKREQILEAIARHTVVYHTFFPGNIPQAQVSFWEHISQKEMEPFYNQYENLFPRMKEWLEKGYAVELAVGNKTAREQLKKDLTDHHLLSGITFREKINGPGFISPTLNVALLSENDIWKKNPEKRHKKKRNKTEERLLAEDLKIGDYVVHESYGIGIFRGVTQAEIDGVTREYLLLQYAGTDCLYLPVDKLDLLYRYSSSEEKQPRLSKLGGSDWERTKKRVADSIKEMAEELLKLYAAREALEGYAFSPDTPWQTQFEEEFIYQETPDQLKAIADVKRDMESRRPMDRLICGDVGYGKTEVAMRAVFKAIMDGKQAAILVPTTVLAEQHYQSFKARFAGYPVVIEALSRFRSSREQKRIVSDLGKGVTDLVIGTHRLLSKDVKFKDLGLLIIDEEHRFGVAQKEKIKALKKMVDVMSLSATPIPRSLHMSLTGLRDLSVIETPPPERYPITTYVLEYNEEIIKEAILAEINRGGQVFFVHNRIEDIYRVKSELEKLVPGLSICLGHGRMKEEELAPIMMDFINGRHQILLCTTIIESGLDIPNVNTIIVDNADKMGLAQLYQLRGRVGRSNRVAYAYLIYRPLRVINETAQKRLNAIREFNELGSGMKIALRDLEIRGAGNILGPEQHGHIHAVGFDLYCRLLEEETAKLRGATLQKTVETQVDIDVDYYIPDSYIPDSGSKMRIYRRLLLAAEEEEVEEIKNELQDRFGTMPDPVENFLRIALLRVMARKKDVKALRRKGPRIEIETSRSLPAELAETSNGMRIRRLDDYTLQVHTGTNTSLEGLQEILNII